MCVCVCARTREADIFAQAPGSMRACMMVAASDTHHNIHASTPQHVCRHACICVRALTDIGVLHRLQGGGEARVVGLGDRLVRHLRVGAVLQVGQERDLCDWCKCV